MRLARSEPTQHGAQSFTTAVSAALRVPARDVRPRKHTDQCADEHERPERVRLAVNDPEQGKQQPANPAEQEARVDTGEQLAPAEPTERDPQDSGEPHVAV